MLAEGAAAAVLADPPCSPGSLRRKLPPGRKTALPVQTSTQLERKTLFLPCEETGGLFCSTERFCDLQKKLPSLLPSCFFSAHSSVLISSRGFSVPSSLPLLALGLCVRADSLGASWRSLGPISSSQHTAVTGARTFFRGHCMLDGSRTFSLLSVAQVRREGG